MNVINQTPWLDMLKGKVHELLLISGAAKSSWSRTSINDNLDLIKVPDTFTLHPLPIVPDTNPIIKPVLQASRIQHLLIPEFSFHHQA